MYFEICQADGISDCAVNAISNFRHTKFGLLCCPYFLNQMESGTNSGNATFGPVS